MDNVLGYHLDWDSGAYAEIDVFRPEATADQGSDPRFQIRYTPPLRGTYRPKVRDLGLRLRNIEDLVGDSLKSLTEILNAGGAFRSVAAAGGDVKLPAAEQAAQTAKIMEKMNRLGRTLLTILMPRAGRDITTAMREGLFLSIGMDEALLAYPWELMYDGEFYCLKHSIGRVVNSAEPGPPPMDEYRWWGARLENFKVLLIDVARTEKRENYKYETLKAAEKEADTIEELLADETLGVKCVRLSNEYATFENVRDRALGK